MEASRRDAIACLEDFDGKIINGAQFFSDNQEAENAVSEIGDT